MPSKITSAGDSKYRVINKSYNGGDCWINISKDLKPLFNYKKDELFDIRIHKEDFIKAINIISILSYGELWECPSKDLIPFHFSNKWFELAYAQITKKFGDEDIAVYKAKHGMYSQGRSYILNNDSDLNIRDFLIERHSLLTIELGSDGILDLRVETSIEDLQKSIITGETSINFAGNTKKSSLQKIIYGAPGTGKSNTIKGDTEAAEKDDRAFRTTFHPDSDYSTFVGCYKPTMKPTGVILASNEKEEVITYKFTPQAFTNAYVKAWNTKEDVYLIIEEINRGNCAQIFGDLFQLLDRKDGYSEYPVDADSDLSNYLQEKLSASTRSDFPKGVKEGVKLVLPNNLYIWATMNTSDQSLFPIDSAFKRRWEWVYIPIKDHEDKNYTIEIGDSKYNWWGFLERINEVINSTTSSEDKKLGYFFAKAEDGIIKAEQFVGKVLFYLWNDVFKNYGFDNPVFEKEDKKKFAFSDFFLADGKPNVEIINEFMERLNEKVEKNSVMIIKKQENPAGTEA